MRACCHIVHRKINCEYSLKCFARVSRSPARRERECAFCCCFGSFLRFHDIVSWLFTSSNLSSRASAPIDSRRAAFRPDIAPTSASLPLPDGRASLSPQTLPMLRTSTQIRSLWEVWASNHVANRRVCIRTLYLLCTSDTAETRFRIAKHGRRMQGGRSDRECLNKHKNQMKTVEANRTAQMTTTNAFLHVDEVRTVARSASAHRSASRGEGADVERHFLVKSTPGCHSVEVD